MRTLCCNCLLLKIELLHSKRHLRASIIQTAGGNWSCLASTILLTAINPEVLSILGNILLISKLTSLQSDVKVLLLFYLSYQ